MEKRYYIRKYIDATRHKHTIIKLKLLGSKGARDYPMTKICVNDKSYFHDKVVEEQIIEFTVNELQTENILSIEMTDKSPKDTEVKNSKIISENVRFTLEIPMINEDLTPFLLTVPLQLLAYHVASLKNLDIDKPRNLAKSVTVE